MFQFTPLMGIHIWSSRNAFMNLQGGYLFPMDELERLRGLSATASVEFSMW